MKYVENIEKSYLKLQNEHHSIQIEQNLREQQQHHYHHTWNMSHAT